MTVSTEELIERSTASFRQALTEQLATHQGDHGPIDFDPESAGQRAATTITAGQVWSSLAGPFTDSAGAGAALGGVSKQAVSQRVSSGSILGLRLASSGNARDRLVYPTWQFHPTVLGLLAQVLRAAGWDSERAVTAWTIAAWLTTPDPSRDDLSPVDLLRAGQLDPVLDSAHQVAESLGTAERAGRRARPQRRTARSARAA